MTTSDISSQILQDQIKSLSELTLSTIEQFEISTERITRECVVCVTDKSIDEFEGIFADTCVHIERTICNSCVYENTKYIVEDSMSYVGDVSCPEPNCNGKFDHNGIRQILLFIGKNKQLFEKYDLHLMYRQLEHMPEFLWCAYNCGSGQLYETGSSNPAVTCKKCNRSTCFKHRVVWHTDMSCDQYDLLNNQPSETDATNKWLEIFAKQCPQCHWHIQKYEGCDHMTCRQCKYEFCWICFVDYKLIASKGVSQHKTTCSHYQVLVLHFEIVHVRGKWFISH
ncbi:unnamed protein product [Rotaria sp. Silwood1]|nr:unnamed protein product [Rotaria sp. Silwood1]